MTFDEPKREALRLDPSSRARLARELLGGLDALTEEVEQLWLEEAVRRDAQMASGEVKPIPMDEVFAELRAARESIGVLPSILTLAVSRAGQPTSTTWSATGSAASSWTRWKRRCTG